MKLMLALFVFIGFSIHAQQDLLTTQFWNNYSHFNPATSGLFYDHQAAVSYRDQWDQVSGAPKSLLANYSILLARHHGIGVNYSHDELGFSRTNQINLNYNYQFILGTRKGSFQKLSVGASVGITQFAMKAAWIPPTTFEDPSLPADFSDIEPNFNAGIAYQGRSLFAGIGVTHLTGASLHGNGANTYVYNQTRHYYAMASHTFRFGSLEKFEIIPRAITRTDMVKISADFNLLAAYSIKEKQRLWLGLGYRTNNAINFMAGCDIYKRYRIGYSYDLTLSKLSSISRGSHEFVLGFYMNNKPRQSKVEEL